VLATSVAASPLGGFTVSAFRFASDFDGPTELVAFRFADDGSPLGASILDVLPGGVVGLSDLAFDSAGNALVVWTEYRFTGVSPGFLRNRGRAIARDGTPLAQPFLIADFPVEQIRTAALPNDTFVNAWASAGNVQGNVVALCTPGAAACGDGVPVDLCEECDEGAANSDTTPDACRSDCTLPRCGDGVTDVAHGEECDDQNSVRCDGCSPECSLELGLACGDGLVSPGCGSEQCDDGNQISGDGCDPTCVLERVLGGGGATTDCDAAWTIDNPANLPLLNKTGSFNGTQLCTDNDPRCDFDGGVPGGCTFHVRACANLTDVDNCTPPTRLASWELLRPSTAQAARRPEVAAVRNAFAPVPGAIVGPDQRNVCSDWLAVPVLLRGSPGRFAAGKVGLKSTAVTYGGDRDTDKLKLVCLPTVP
jgi:cysteine-rich repeat protein